MGSYCKLYLSSFLISNARDEIDPFLLSTFQPEDLVVSERKIEDCSRLLNSDDQEDEITIQFVSTAQKLKERLNVIGFTMKKVGDAFEKSKKNFVDLLNSLPSDSNKKFLIDENKYLLNSESADFLEALKEIIENEIVLGKRYSEKSKNQIVNYLIEDQNDLEKFPYDYDRRILLRAVLEFARPETKITCDISEYVVMEHLEIDPKFIYNEIISSITYDYGIENKFLILTEGSSDIYILKKSLEILYPHLCGYYLFMDFGVSNASGSASSLVASVKSFVGASISNKIIALFDNDTAAESAMRGLSKTEIPDNIKIVQYPDIKFLNEYPTVDSSGIKKMNINGFAGSIEMYLGKDTLTIDQELSPVKWKGYDSLLKKRQGEISDKSIVQKKFKKRIRTCLENSQKIENYDWRGIQHILQLIFDAFNE